MGMRHLEEQINEHPEIRVAYHNTEDSSTYPCNHWFSVEEIFGWRDGYAWIGQNEDGSWSLHDAYHRCWFETDEYESLRRHLSNVLGDVEGLLEEEEYEEMVQGH